MTSILSIRVTPRSSKPGVAWRTSADGRDELEVRVSEPPTAGAANTAVVKLLAKLLGISRSEVTLVSGHAGRHKRVAVPYDVDEIRKRLGAPQERTIKHV